MATRVFLCGEAGGTQLRDHKQALLEYMKTGEGTTIELLAQGLGYDKDYVECVLLPELVAEGKVKLFETKSTGEPV